MQLSQAAAAKCTPLAARSHDAGNVVPESTGAVEVGAALAVGVVGGTYGRGGGADVGDEHAATAPAPRHPRRRRIRTAAMRLAKHGAFP